MAERAELIEAFRSQNRLARTLFNGGDEAGARAAYANAIAIKAEITDPTELAGEIEYTDQVMSGDVMAGLASRDGENRLADVYRNAQPSSVAGAYASGFGEGLGDGFNNLKRKVDDIGGAGGVTLKTAAIAVGLVLAIVLVVKVL